MLASRVKNVQTALTVLLSRDKNEGGEKKEKSIDKIMALNTTQDEKLKQKKM
jgi:hypothetical protein